MRTALPNARLAGLLTAVFLSVCLSRSALAAKPTPTTKLSLDPSARRVDLFAAQDEGLVTIRVVPADEMRANVFVENTSSESLTVESPKSVVAVHGVKPAPPPPQAAESRRAVYPADTVQPNQAQSVGGQLFGLGPAADADGEASAALFSIPAGGAVRIQLQSVCLNLGNPTPTSRMKYRLMRMSDYTGDAAVLRLFDAVDLRRTDRETLQAAAWNIANGVPFEKLAAQRDPRNAARPMFTPAQLAAARDMVAEARKAGADGRN